MNDNKERAIRQAKAEVEATHAAMDRAIRSLALAKETVRQASRAYDLALMELALELGA